MKKFKALLVVACALLLVAASVFGTMAYLTSTDKVTNTFTVGKVKITLDEAKVGTDGKALTGSGAARVQANSYKLINNASALKEVFGANFLPQNYVDNTWDAQTWPCVKTTVNNDETVTYEFRYKEIVEANAEDQKLDALFKSFTVPGTVNGDQLAKLGGLEIKVIGEAIQADGFKSADEAWGAFDNK